MSAPGNDDNGQPPPPGGFGAPPAGFGSPGAPPPNGFGDFAPHAPQSPFGGGFAGSDRSYAEGKVKAPAITMMVLIGLGALMQMISVVMNVIGNGMNASNANSDRLAAALSSGAVGIAMSGLAIASSVFSFYGLLKMMRLQSRNARLRGGDREHAPVGRKLLVHQRVRRCLGAGHAERRHGEAQLHMTVLSAG